MDEELVRTLKREYEQRFPAEPTAKWQWLSDRIRRCISWLEMATEAEEYTSREFIGLWIALNSLYGQRVDSDEEPRERERFLQFLKWLRSQDPGALSADTVLQNDGIELMKNQFLWNAYWNGDASYEGLIRGATERADQDLREGRVKEFIASVFGRISILRNQIFHGSASKDTPRNRWALQPACRFLRKTIPSIVGSMLKEQVKTPWPALPYPGFGTPGHPKFPGRESRKSETTAD